MANVLFKRGLHANLFTESFVPQDGVFYLTEDSHRLYVGQGSQLVDLNKYITVAATTANLPTAPKKNDFAWVAEGNMLLVCTTEGVTGLAAWTQVNPDTNTNDNTVVLNTSNAIVESDTDSVDVKVTIKQQKTDVNETKTQLEDIVIPFSITKAQLDAIIDEEKVGLGAIISNGVATIATEGEGSDPTANITITGGGNITVGGSADKIEIIGENTTYDLVSPENATTITLTGTDVSTDTVTFEAGKQLVATGTDANKIIYSHATITDNGKNNPSAKEIDANGITVVTDVAYDNGHVTGLTVGKYTLPKDQNTTYTVKEVGADNAGKITVQLQGSDESTPYFTSDADLYYTVNGVKVYNQGTIDFYTKDEVDFKIRGIDAMTYRGTLGGDGATETNLPTINVSAGDTYKVAEAGTYGEITVEVGDLVIATGIEGDNGYLGVIEWTIVPSGDDVDTTYSLEVANNTVSLINKVTNAKESVTLIEGNNNDDIEITTSDRNITIAHKDYADLTGGSTTAITPAAGDDITIVTGVQSTNGHITGVTTQKVTLPDNENTTYDLTAAAVTVDASTKITLTDNNQSNSIVFFDADTTNDSLKVNSTDGKIIYKHTDYTFTAPTEMTSNTTQLEADGKLKVVTGATVNNGHITELTVTEYQLPSDNDTKLATHTFTAASVTNGTKLTSVTSDTSGASKTDDISLTSTSLQIATTNDAAVTIDMVWGTF